MVTQRELDDLTNEMMELTGEMRELKGMLLRRLSEAMVAVKTEQRTQERIEERLGRLEGLEIRDTQTPPGTQPTYFGENIENLKTRVTKLETYHSLPKIQNLEIPRFQVSSSPSETTSSPQ